LGTSALGGRRTSLQRTRDWYARLYRLLPDIHFDIDRITVSGTPWNTLAVVEWQERNSGTDGVVTTNRGIHAVHIRWGKMTRLIICPDTTLLIGTLDRLARAGVEEAHAPMIEG
ncbi:MAG: nuclear transport factor 2 family protein, partial [Devosia sp.]|nr:nuclear transport factor 2 family protein [Devosia sp.]